MGVNSHTTTDGVTWTETWFATVITIVNSGRVIHMTVDECGRRWVSRADSTMIIYGSDGTYLGNFTLASVGIFDAMFMDDHVLYVADSWGGNIIRLDPRTTC
jgi:hypothetical protein